MNFNINDAYATPIYAGVVGFFDEIQSEIKKSIEDIDFSMRDDWGSTHHLSDTGFNENAIEKYNLNSFKVELDNHIKDYCDVIGFKTRDYILEASWLSLFRKGNYGHVHTHGSADISGVYYYQTTGNDGNLFFESPVPNMGGSLVYNGLANRQEFKPENGRLVLFPGWLPHGIMTNTTDDTRISLSFNIIFDRMENNYG